MAQKQKLKLNKIIFLTVIVFILIVICVVVYQIRKTNSYTVYLAEDGRYTLQLNEDGTFLFYDVASSKLTVATDNFYRWAGDMLVLEFGVSDNVLYFRQEKGTLVFQEDLSVWKESFPLSNGTVFEKS